MAIAKSGAALICSAALLCAAATPTFNRDVAPILNEHCVVCHRPGNIAPMSFRTFAEARPWAAAIREAVATRQMPPWHGDPAMHKFSNDPRLSDRDVAVLTSWASGGAPEGDPKVEPPRPSFPDSWHIRPDIILPIPEPQIVPPGSEDAYEYIHVPTHFTEDKWVQVAEVLPGDSRIVHHATVSVWAPDPPPLSSEKDEGKPHVEYRYRTGKVNHIRPEIPVVDDGCSSPAGGDWPDNEVRPGTFVAIFLPGHVPEVRPAGYAIRIPKDATLEFQIHYSNRTGKSVSDRTALGLVLAKEPVTHAIQQYEIWNNLFALPPGDANHRVTSCYTLSRDVLALAYTAHMHFRGKSFRTVALFPDGHTEILFSVPRYDFHWQETYMLSRPEFLPKGTRLRSVAVFDNSEHNPLNPDATKLIRWGEPSNEEMMGFWLAFTDPSPELSASSPALGGSDADR